MSVINQLLLDLEKRRASPTERSALPTHVRALPEPEPSRWGWVAVGGVVVAAVAGMAWSMLSGFDWTQRRAAAAPSMPSRAAAVAVEKSGSQAVASAKGIERPGANGDGGREGPASQLTFELSALPARVAEPPVAVPAPIAAARIVAPAREEAPVRSEPPAAPVAAKRAGVATARTPAGEPHGKVEISKHVRQPTAPELAEAEYGKSTNLLHQGRLAEAQEGFRAALNHHPVHHGARQALVGLLVESRSLSEAERALQEGLALAPGQTGFAMTLARLQVDRGDNAQAIATLQKGLDHARANADYLAFLAALLQRQSRHEDAIAQYQAALRLKPSAGVWWIGLGISLQAANRPADAQDAYRRARASTSLNAELAAFAEQRLRQLQ